MYDDLVRIIDGSLANLLIDNRSRRSVDKAPLNAVGRMTGLADAGIASDPSFGLLGLDTVEGARQAVKQGYWQKSFGGTADIPGVGYGYAARLTHKGRAIGADFVLTDKWSMVAMAARSKGRTFKLMPDRYRDKRRLKMHGLTLGLGTRYEDDHWRAGGAGLFTINRVKGRRDGPLGSALLHRSHRGHHMGFAFDAGYRDRIGNVRFQAVTRTSFSALTQSGYRESGGVAALVVNEVQRKRLTSEVGGSLGQEFRLQNGSANWVLEAVWQRDWREETGAANSRLALSGDGSRFRSAMTSGQDSQLVAGFRTGVTHKTTDAGEWGLGLHMRAVSGSEGEQYSAGMTLSGKF